MIIAGPSITGRPFLCLQQNRIHQFLQGAELGLAGLDVRRRSTSCQLLMPIPTEIITWYRSLTNIENVAYLKQKEIDGSFPKYVIEGKLKIHHYGTEWEWCDFDHGRQGSKRNLCVANLSKQMRGSPSSQENVSWKESFGCLLLICTEIWAKNSISLHPKLTRLQRSSRLTALPGAIPDRGNSNMQNMVNIGCKSTVQ